MNANRHMHVWIFLLLVGATVFGIASAAGAPLDLSGAIGTLMLCNAPLAIDTKARLETLLGELEEHSKTMPTIRNTVDQMKDHISELKQRQLDLEQKIAHRPGNLGGGKDSEAGLAGPLERLQETVEFKSLLRGAKISSRVELEPGESFKTAIITPAASGGGATPLTEPGRAPMIAPAMRRMTIRALLPTAPTVNGSIDYPTETSYTSAAAPQFNSPNDRENVIKGESAFAFSLSNVRVTTIAHWVPASRQVLADSPALLAYLEGRLQYGLALEEEDQILNGDGTGGNMTGLWTSRTGYNRGVSNDTMLDTILKGILQLAIAEHVATGVILNPIDWTQIRLLKDTQGRYLFGDPNQGAASALWGLPVVATNSMPSGSFLTADFPQAAQIWDRQEASIEVSASHDDFFIRNMVAILAEERLALTIYRSSAIVGGTLPALGT